MFANMRRQFGTAGLAVAIVALIVALGGGAYAATQSRATHKKKSRAALTGKQVREVKKIAKHYAGKPGTNGTSGGPGPEGKQGPKGEPGKPGPLLETLPAGKSLQGVWGTSGGTSTTEATAGATISFQFPLESAPAVVYVWADNTTVGLYGFRQSLTAPGEALETAAEVEAFCPGSSSEPEATAGNLCIYTTIEENGGVLGPSPISFGEISRFGTTLPNVVFTSEGWIQGTWAVTAE